MRHFRRESRTLSSGIGKGNGAWAPNLRHFGCEMHSGNGNNENSNGNGNNKNSNGNGNNKNSNGNARRVAMAVATTRTATRTAAILSSGNVTKLTKRQVCRISSVRSSGIDKMAVDQARHQHNINRCLLRSFPAKRGGHHKRLPAERGAI